VDQPDERVRYVAEKRTSKDRPYERHEADNGRRRARREEDAPQGVREGLALLRAELVSCSN
jgi:hypothetical protein